MASTGPEFRMTATCPTQDELKKWAAYCCSRYQASTDTVWVDDVGQDVSLAQLFPKQDGTLGSMPTVFVPATPTLAELQDPVLKVVTMARYKMESDLVASIKKHIRSASVNISQMLVRTISAEMTTILRNTVIGIATMDDLTNPLSILNYIMAKDYSLAAQMVTDPIEQYHNAKVYFDSTSVKQKDTGESSTVFAVRFNAEYQKVQQLAGVAGLQAQLMTAQLLTYSFLSKLNKKYDTLKSDYDKGNKVKPVTIAGVVLHCLYWDNLPTASGGSQSKYTPAERAAYAIQRAQQKRNKSVNANIAPVVSKYKCIMHKTDLHVWNDPVCIKAKEAYRVKRDAAKAAEKSA